MHQQFQEWYASQGVEQCLIAACQSEFREKALVEFSTDIIDQPIWEETLFFTIARLGEKGGDNEAVAIELIIRTLNIDPVFAARLAYHVSNDVWKHVESAFVKFVDTWHQKNTVDRACRVMITSGSCVFEDKIWKLLGGKDQQLYLETLRSVQPFELSVLGENWLERFNMLPSDNRQDIAFEFATDCGLPGLDAAVLIAQRDPDVSVQISALKGLDFSRSSDRLETIMDGASDNLLQAVAEHYYSFDSFTQPTAELVLKIVRASIGDTSIPDGQLNLVYALDRADHPDAGILLLRALETHPAKRTGHQFDQLLESSFKHDSEQTSKVLVRKILEERWAKPEWRNFLIDITDEEKDSLIECAVSKWKGSFGLSKFVGAVLNEEDCNKLLEQVFALEDEVGVERPSDDQHETRSNLENLLTNVDHEILAKVVTTLSDDLPKNYVGIVVRILIVAGGEVERNGNFVLRQESLITLAGKKIENWVIRALTDQDWKRWILADIAIAIGRVGAPDSATLINQLLLHELERVRAAKKIALSGRITDDARMNYMRQYKSAFLASPSNDVSKFLIDLLYVSEFGRDAAFALSQMAQNETPEFPPLLSRSPDFSSVVETRVRKKLRKQAAPHPYAIAIMKQVSAIKDEGKIEGGISKGLVASMAASVVLIPYGSLVDEIVEALTYGTGRSFEYYAFEKLVLKGEVISAEKLISFCDNYVQLLNTEFYRLDENWYAASQWLSLLIFSSAPEEAYFRIRVLPKEIKNTNRIGRVLKALGASRTSEALILLEELLGQNKNHDGFKWDWVLAVSLHGTEEAALLMLSKLESGHGIASSRANFASVLAEFAIEFPTIMELILALPSENTPDRIRDCLAEVLNCISTQEAAIASCMLLNDEGSQPIPSPLWNLYRKVGEHRSPVEGYEGIFNLETATVAALRKHLFCLVCEDVTRSKSAAKILEHIDAIREEFGRPLDEPRHPDIATNLPWPMK